MKLLVDEATPFASAGGDVEVEVQWTGSGWRMAVANGSGAAVRVRAAGVVVPVDHAGGLRLFANGFQSWSPTGVLRLGVDRDPSLREDSFELFCAAHHADQRRAREDELRSELVTVLADDGDAIACAGWLGGDRHDGTFRLRPAGGGAELVVEAHLGDVELAAGERRELHEVAVTFGERGQHAELLDAWAAAFGRHAGARAGAPYQVGWCSWYHYFSEVTEAALDANLAVSSEWPFEVFQLDDGFQLHIGDWLGTNAKFRSPLDAIAARIAAAGRRPGIWIAPFLAHPDSEVHRRHPEWIATMPEDPSAPLPGMINDIWGGIVNVLDTSHPEVLAYLESVASSLVEAGFTYLKLDFTYAPSFDGRYHDPSMTPAQRVRAGYDAIRRGAGDGAFILGCGAPLGPCVGVVDGMRIGPDVAPSWHREADRWDPSGYLDAAPATRNAWQATLARSFMHRRLWLNDPDCLMLRTEHTAMDEDAVEAWAAAVAASGGMALVSDDLSLLGADARARLDRVIDVGRRVDAAARDGAAPACPDLLESRPPTTLASAAAELVGDPAAGRASLTVAG